MKLDHLYYFCAVASLESVSRAAEKLHIAQPYLSKCMRNLETELGGELFEKKGRGIALTPEGQAYYQRVKRALDMLDEAKSEFSQVRNTTQEIKVYNSTAPRFTAKFIVGYQAEHPDCRVLLKSIYTLGLAQLKYMDLCIASEQDETVEGLEVVDTLEEEMILLIPNQFALNVGDGQPLTLLEDYPFVVDWPESFLRKHLEELRRQTGFIPNVRYVAGEISTFTTMIQQGLGIAYVPAITFWLFEKELFDEYVFPVRILESPIRRKILLLTDPKAQSPKEVGAFLDSYRNYLHGYQKLYEEESHTMLTCTI